MNYSTPDQESRPLEHVCSWNLRSSRNSADYQLNFCRGCGRVTNFHWKSFWRRLRCVFRNDMHHEH
jgi:hypothetical protein